MLQGQADQFVTTDTKTKMDVQIMKNVKPVNTMLPPPPAFRVYQIYFLHLGLDHAPQRTAVFGSTVIGPSFQLLTLRKILGSTRWRYHHLAISNNNTV